MKSVYLLRHSKRDLRIHDDTAPLSKEGLKLATGLAEFFRDKDIDYILTSPSKRAIQTIKPIARILDIPWQTDPCLRERWIGFWVEDHDQYIKNQWEDFSYKEGRGESLNDVRARTIKPFKDLLNEHSHCENLLISSHRTLIGIILNEFTGGKFSYEEITQMSQPDVYRMDFSNGEFVGWAHEDWKN